MTRHFARYVAIRCDLHTSLVLDCDTDRVVVDKLSPDDATQLARDWNKYEPPDPTICVHDDGTWHQKAVTA